MGAHHPTHYSNTYYFYLLGWNGVNIDARPGGMAPFRQQRSRDINVEAAIAGIERDLTFYEMSEPAMSGFDQSLIDARLKGTGVKLLSKQVMKTRTLASVLNDSIDSSRTIDFLTVDVEGLDLEVLMSNDWNRWRPKLVVAEDSSATSLDDAIQAPISKLMRDLHYVPIAKAALSIFFADSAAIRTGPRGLTIC